ncbi:MAG: hypothetical protein HOP91_08525 [Sphingomonas sp.]|nr:hypothetical protein [Sphingomonas sp.]
MARTRRTADSDAAAEKAVERFLSRHELRYILIEVAIVATGVFIALLVDELRQTLARRSLIAQTRSALHAELASNQARIFFKARLIHEAAIALEKHPELAPELVRQRRNSLVVPFEAEWSFASQNGVLRYLPADERRRLTNAYVINAGYAELVHDEMTAWTQLAAVEGPGASSAEARDRAKAVALWMAYAQRLALASCVSTVNLQRAMVARLATVSPGKTCASYQAETDPSLIFQQLGVSTPAAEPL